MLQTKMFHHLWKAAEMIMRVDDIVKCAPRQREG